MKEDLRLRLPRPEDVEDEVIRLEHLIEYTNEKKGENELIAIRAEDTHFTYENEEYMIRLPMSGAEICLEAIRQHNCLSTYARPHAIGDTTIAFLRRKTNLDATFVSLEIQRDEIKQVCGKFNVNAPKEVYLFLEEYAEEKRLDFNPHHLIHNRDFFEFFDFYDMAEFFGWEETHNNTSHLDKYLKEYDERQRVKKKMYTEEYHQQDLSDYIPEIIAG